LFLPKPDNQWKKNKTPFADDNMDINRLACLEHIMTSCLSSTFVVKHRLVFPITTVFYFKSVFDFDSTAINSNKHLVRKEERGKIWNRLYKWKDHYHGNQIILFVSKWIILFTVLVIFFQEFVWSYIFLENYRKLFFYEDIIN